MKRTLSLCALSLLLTGCYHATIETGLRPSTGPAIEEKWAHSWLGGLVPPDEMEVGDDCPFGVARVETELSFLNQVAAALTAGIYTPMTLRAICAAESAG